MYLHHWSKKLFLIFAVLDLVSCKSVQKVVPVPTPIQADGQALTSRGESTQPAFSPDGQKILYVSIERANHHAGQIYELDLKSQKERRITFQGTAAHGPQYNHTGDAILYASATD